MKTIGICGISHLNNNINLASYTEKCTLNTILNLTSLHLKSHNNRIIDMGIYSNIDNALYDCRKKGVDTLYVTSKNILKDMKADTNGIDVMYF